MLFRSGHGSHQHPDCAGPSRRRLAFPPDRPARSDGPGPTLQLIFLQSFYVFTYFYRISKLMVYLPMSPGCGERTITFICLIGKPFSFSDFRFNLLNEFLSICMFRLDHASVLAI